MEAPVEIRYAGVVIGRAQEVRAGDDESVFFLLGKEPMPVGTVLHLRAGAREASARVLRSVESPDASVAGMRVRLIGEAEGAAADWIPAPAQPKTASKPGTPTPTVEVDVGLMQAELAKHAPASAPVPEAVPVTVGSSLTGALEKAAAGAPAEPAQPEAADALAPAAEAAPAGPAADRAITVESPTLPEENARPAVASDAAPAAESAGEAASGDNADAAEEAADEGGAGAADEGAAGDMPPARPIAGPTARRKTKRRR